MKIYTCNFCSSEEQMDYLTLNDRFSGEAFKLVACKQCGLLFLNPQPNEDEIAQYYPQDYEPYVKPGTHGADDLPADVRLALSIYLDFVEKYAPRRGRLLDVGCATGNFLAAAQTRGWEVTGVEFVEVAAKVAIEQYGLDVKIGALESAKLLEESYNLITLWDVLEHLPNPRETLERCWKLLAPGGLIIFSVPNLKSFDRYLFGKRWIGWEAPRHFHLFPASTIQQVLDQSGFEMIDQVCFIGGRGTFFLSLDTILDGSKLAGVTRKLYPLIGALLWPYRKISYLLRRGPIITYVARKRNPA
jgi:SAM-dependent methyltransferase